MKVKDLVAELLKCNQEHDIRVVLDSPNEEQHFLNPVVYNFTDGATIEVSLMHECELE